MSDTKNLGDKINEIEKLIGLDGCKLNCNVFSVYDYNGYSLQELLCVFYTKINECINICNLTLELAKWLVNEGLAIEVAKKLEEWLLDGTLAKIINEVIFKELNDKVNANAEEIQNIKDLLDELMKRPMAETLDIRESEPFYLTQIECHKTTVSQGLCVDHDNLDLYMAQVYVTSDWTTDGENFVINHCKADGTLIDYMILKYGGHGTEFGLKKINGTVYIYTNWNKVDGSGNVVGYELVKIKYGSGIKTIADGTILNKFTSNYVVPTVSSDGQYIALRDGQKVDIRYLADVENGVNNLLSSFTIESGLNWLQGFTLDDELFYWRTGDTNEATYQDLVTVYEWRTGTKLYQKHIDTGSNKNDFTEPEGITLLQRGLSKSLLLMQVKNQTLRRSHMVYCIGQGKTGINLLGEQAEKRLLYQDDGKAFVIPITTNKLSDIKKTGWYYITTNDAKGFIDHPQNDGGGFLFVSPHSDNNKAYYQEYIRANGTNASAYKVHRYVVDGVATGWGGSGMELTLWEGDTRSDTLNTSYSLLESLKGYDYVLCVYNNPQGVNNTQFTSMKYFEGNQLTYTCVNLEDSTPHSLFIYEHTITFNTDFTGFTLTKRNSLSFKTDPQTPTTDTNTVGLKRIVGIRM